MLGMEGADFNLRNVLEIPESRHWFDVAVCDFWLIIKYHLREVIDMFHIRGHSLFRHLGVVSIDTWLVVIFHWRSYYVFRRS